jgi:hypothetical protein
MRRKILSALVCFALLLLALPASAGGRWHGGHGRGHGHGHGGWHGGTRVFVGVGPGFYGGYGFAPYGYGYWRAPYPVYGYGYGYGYGYAPPRTTTRRSTPRRA